MTEDILKRMNGIARWMWDCRRHYDTLTTEENYNYDIALKTLIALKEQYPEYRADEDPTEIVGGQPDFTTFAPVHHDPPMLSLDKVHSMEELEAWLKKTEKLVRELQKD
jgi:DNA ligase (NAD+)